MPVQFNDKVETISGTDTGKQNAPGSNGFPPSFARMRELDGEVGGEKQAAVGLRNLGATCYMNSLLQTMFATPELRSHVLQWNFSDKQRHDRNVAYQLQLLFMRLQRPDLHSNVKPDALINSFGMGDDAHREQHDVQELNRKLLDVFQEGIDLSGGDQVLHRLYRGKYVDYKECCGCKHRTESVAFFDDLSVPCQGLNNFAACMKAYEQPSEIEGFHCDACDSSQTILKGLQFQSFPPVLTIQLVRMSFDMTTFRRVKIEDPVALPLEVNLADLVDEKIKAKLTEVPADNVHRLHSIICHRGNAYHGHYFAFVRTDVGWFKFDDEAVTPVEDADMEEYLDPETFMAKKAAAAGQSDDADTDEHFDPFATTDVGTGTADDFVDTDVFSMMDSNTTTGQNGVKKPSAQVYYAIYRSSALPTAASLSFRSVLDNNVEAVNATEAKAITAKVAELEKLKSVLNVAIHGPPKQEGKKTKRMQYWIETSTATTITQLQELALKALSEEEQAALSAAKPGTELRLRAYSDHMDTLGDSYSTPDETTLGDLGFKPESSCFARFAFESSADGGSMRSTKGWDMPVKVHWPLPDDTKENADGVSYAEDWTSVRVYAQGTIGDLIKSILREGKASVLGENLSPADVVLTVRRDGSGVLLSWTNEHLDDTLVDNLRVEIRGDERVYIERKDLDAWKYDLGESRAAKAILLSHVMLVSFALTTNAQETFTTTIDRRKTLRVLKTQLCTTLQLDPENSQLLLDDAAREPRQLDATLNTMALGQKSISVAVAPFPPLPPDHSLVDVFVANVNDYISPVKKLGKIPVNPQTSVDEVLGKINGDLPAANGFRPRLMPPGKTGVLGVPLTNSLVFKNMTPHHRQDELRLVFEPLFENELEAGASPECVLSVSGEVVLHLHVFDSTIEDPVAAIGKGRELIVTKSIQEAGFRAKVLAALGLPAEPFKEEATDADKKSADDAKASNTSPAEEDPVPREFEIAVAKYYQLRTHDAACSKVRWDALNPLRLDMDDIVVVHRVDDVWEHASDSAIASKGTAAAERAKKRKRGEGKKAPREERGITITSVWEVEDETPTDEASPVELPEVESSGNDASSAPPTDAAAAPSGDEGGLIDFLPFEEFNDTIKTLEETCGICQCEMEEGETVVILGRCHHVFHRECLAPWLKINPTCPACGLPVLE